MSGTWRPNRLGGCYTMSKSLKKAIEYFQDKRDNPCSAKVAMDIVIFLNLWYKKKTTIPQ
ncbi:hypothetical protein [Moorena bouillonii]|uniref:hypothetical protein n=1 Tax=Moorena bouillonii TaxID=207920 RepID=UPI00117E5870|nr:hypothetical protein [Moorena bouillonii]